MGGTQDAQDSDVKILCIVVLLVFLPFPYFLLAFLSAAVCWISMIKNVVRYVIVSFCFGSMIACAQSPTSSAAAAPKLETDEQKTLYTLGLLLGRNIKPFALKPEELAIVKAGR